MPATPLRHTVQYSENVESGIVADGRLAVPSGRHVDKTTTLFYLIPCGPLIFVDMLCCLCSLAVKL